MDNEARLRAALAAGAAPARDPAFTMAVMRAAEAERYRRETIHSMLKWAGMAAAAASLIVPFLGWAGAHAEALENGVLGAGSLLALVAAARFMSARATAMLRH
jgi:hypothetical protein